MAYTIKQDIVVPSMYVYNASQLQPGFHQIHLHSTGNPNSSVQNERDYLAGHYTSANYTHLVGITNGQVDIRQVMNTNGGAWDVGGDWNWETWAAIEFVEGSIKSQADFDKAYPAYIWLARYLANKAGIPYTIDNLNTSGIKTHNYASATGHGSDHVDPIPFLAKWGVSRDKLNKDIVNGITPTPTPDPVKQDHTFANDEKVELKSYAEKSAFGTPFTADVKKAYGRVAWITPKKQSKSTQIVKVGFFYNNRITYWNVLAQDLHYLSK